MWHYCKLGMTKATHKDFQKPWPIKKRIGVAVVGTVMILLTAYVLGGGIYAIATTMGLISPQQLKKSEVVKQLVNDPKVVAAIHTAATSRECVNKKWSITFVYRPPFEPLVLDGDLACSQWSLPGSDGVPSRLLISVDNRSKNEVVAQELEGLAEVMTESFDHQLANGTKIMGIRDGRRYAVFVIDRGNDRIVVQVWPMQEMYQDQLDEFVQNMIF